MTDDTDVQSEHTTSPSDQTERPGWTAWIKLAGVMLIISGSLNVLYGLIAAVDDEQAPSDR